MNKTITPFFWFDTQAEEAVNFYVSLFDDAKILSIDRHQSGPLEGKVLTVVFQLRGRTFMALDGGPMFRFTEAVSLFVNCETQAEVDRLWDALSAGGDPEAQQCGWLKDRYGLTWQIVPEDLPAMLTDADPVRAQRVFQAMLPMKKLVIADLKKAWEGS